MSRNRKRKNSSLKNNQLTNGLTDLATNIGNQGTGGSYLSSYASQAFTNNYALLTLNRIILTYMYTGNGIFQTAIQLPIQDAIGKGIIIESSELDNTDIEDIYALWEEKEIWDKVLDYYTWVRLFGGGGLLINTNQDPEKPFNLNKMHNKPFELYDLDRWQLDTGVQLFDELETSRYYNEADFVYLYGEKIHRSRLMLSRGKRAPHHVRQQLRGWGMSEGERMIRALNATAKAQDASFELIDEAKIDVYKIEGLANKLLTTGGTDKIMQRIQAANMIKNYVNALVLDGKEEFTQKMVNFAGLAEVMNQNRIETASAVRMPMTKLYGLSSNGFNTGESDLENYNQMVEFSVRTPLRPTIRQLIEVSCSHLFGYVPTFNFEYPPLREQTPEVEQTVKTGETNRILSFYDRGLMDSQEVMESARKAGIVQIETKAEQGLLPPQPTPPEPATGEAGSGISANPRIGKEHSKSSPSPNRNSLTYSGHPLQDKTEFQGMKISVENKKGSIREGVDADGKPWKTKFQYPYGYIRGTVGVDKDHVDCYLGDNPEAEKAFIIHQNVPETGKYDEDKVMLGFDSKESAQKAYEDHYNKPGFFGGMKIVSVDKLKKLMDKRKGKKL